MELEDEIKLQILSDTQVTVKSKRRVVCVKRTYHPWGMSAVYKEIGIKKSGYKCLYQRLRILYKKSVRYFTR